jgi:hypothetical protein
MDEDAVAQDGKLEFLERGIAGAHAAVLLADAQIDSLIAAGFPIEQMDLEFQASFRARVELAGILRDIAQVNAAWCVRPFFRPGAAAMAAV